MVYQYLKSPDWMNNVVEAENLKQQLKLQSNLYKKNIQMFRSTIKELSVKSQFQNKAT
jgi:D-mannonate dehydratase